MAEVKQGEVAARISLRMKADVTARYSFTGQFILGAKYFAEQAALLEKKSHAGEDFLAHHKAYVSAAIMQSTAALESEIWQITRFGPGQHLGSDQTDSAARDLLDPIKDEIDRQPIIRRFEMVLHLLGKEEIDRGGRTHAMARLLVQLRNEITHYKSQSGPEMDRQKLYKSLEKLSHKPPPYARNSRNFFPHKCLSAECAEWAWQTADAFLTEFSRKLGKPSVLDGYLRRK